MIEMFNKIKEYFNLIIDSFKDFYKTLTFFINMIPSPFKEILLSAIILFIILITLKIKEKFV